MVRIIITDVSRDNSICIFDLKILTPIRSDNFYLYVDPNDTIMNRHQLKTSFDKCVNLTHMCLHITG